MLVVKMIYVTKNQQPRIIYTPAAYQCMFLLKTYNYTYFKDANNFLDVAVMFSKYNAKDPDTLIEQSFIYINQLN